VPSYHYTFDNFAGFVSCRADIIGRKIGSLFKGVVSKFVQFRLVDYLSLRLPGLLYAVVESIVILLESLKNILLSIFWDIRFNLAGLSNCSHNLNLSCLSEYVKKNLKGGKGQFLLKLPQTVSLPEFL
jgi:hypothetical protein